MKVKAKAVGHYGKLREVGEEFEISGPKHLGSWMEPVREQPKKPEGEGEKK